MVLAINALTRGLITVVSKAIALTRLTGGELPEVELTLVTMLALYTIVAVTLTRLDVAKIILGTASVTVTRGASIWSEAISTDGTVGTSASVNVGTTQTIATTPITHTAS